MSVIKARLSHAALEEPFPDNSSDQGNFIAFSGQPNVFGGRRVFVGTLHPDKTLQGKRFIRSSKSCLWMNRNSVQRVLFNS
jgi:hypothetical protein